MRIMTRKQFIEGNGATCKNWTWSWSFINENEKIIIFGSWDYTETGHMAIIFSYDWKYDDKNRKKAAYDQSLEHIRLIEEEGYQLKSFPIYHSDKNKDENGFGPAKIDSFKAELTDRVLGKVNNNYYACSEIGLNNISEEVIYQVSKRVQKQELSKKEGVSKLVEELGMNEGSAKIIIGQVFPKFISGEQFSRTLNNKLFDHFLKRISEDYGSIKLSLALKALKLHIDYIEKKGDPKKKLRTIYQQYLSHLRVQPNGISKDEVEQEEISKYFKKSKSKAEIIEALNNLTDKGSEKVTINRKAYKRDNRTVALIKILRNFECQICGLSIAKKDGSKYVEAAHIVPKHMKGAESPDNIILLCPNHHKEFDLGDCEIEEHTKNELKFMMNGKRYELSLSVE